MTARSGSLVHHPSAMLTPHATSHQTGVHASCQSNHTAQISSSIFLAGDWDYMDWFRNGSSNCLSMVDR